MAARNLLHRDRLQEFLKWCVEEKKLEVREGRGIHEAAQILPKGSKNWQVIFTRNRMPEHLTVPDPLIPLVLNFIRSTRTGTTGQPPGVSTLALKVN